MVVSVVQNVTVHTVSSTDSAIDTTTLDAATPLVVTSAVPALAATSAATSAATGIGANPLVTYNWNPAVQLTHFLAAEASVAAGVAGARAKIVAIGDSTTAGVGADAVNYRTDSYPAELAKDLDQDGIPSQFDNFTGGGLLVDARLNLVGGANWSGAQAAGGQVIQTYAPGDGVDFTLATSGVYDRVDINYIDIGSGSATIAVDGGPTLATLQFGGTGQMKTQTVDLPAGSHDELSIRATSANNLFLEGASFWNSTTPAVEVYDAGKGGADSSVAGTGSLSGYGVIQGAAELAPNLVLIDYGINDINNNTETTAQTVANIATMVTTFRSVNADPIIVIPEPFNSGNYATGLPALRLALEALSTTMNVPLIDLSATYDNSYAELAAAGLMSDNLHPNAALYSDIGAGIASLLAAATTASATAAPAPAKTSPATTPSVITPLLKTPSLTTPSLTIASPVTPAPVTPSPVTLGAGPNSLLLEISEDAYLGDAQFTVSVDGTQIGGTQTATASHAAGQDQAFTVLGGFAAGTHTVGVDFLNDAYGGSAALDRNLYVDSIIDGATTSPVKAALLDSGTQSFVVGTATTPVTPSPISPNPVTLGAGPNSLVLEISEDAYLGDAQFTVSVDGIQIGGTQTATASHAAGQDQAFTVLGSFAAGAHTIGVDFLNDAYGGSPALDRNLYVDSITDAATTSHVQAALLNSGTQSFVASDMAPATGPVTLGAGPNSLVLEISEDAWNGDAQFTVSVDGIQIGGTQTATASHAAGQDQAFTVLGSFAAGTHTIGVDFLNDAYGGSPTLDRNLYVDSITDGATTSPVKAALLDSGTQSFVVGGASAVTHSAIASITAATVATSTPGFVASAAAPDTAAVMASSTLDVAVPSNPVVALSAAATIPEASNVPGFAAASAALSSATTSLPAWPHST